MTTIEEPRLEVDEEIERMLSMLDTPSEVAAPDYARAMVERDALWTVAGMMRAARRLDAELDRDRTYLHRLEMEVLRRNSSKVRSLAFLHEQIKAHAEALLLAGSKHVDIPGAGRVQFTDRKEAIRIEDHDAFIEALSADERARLAPPRPHLNVNDAKEYQRAVLETDGGQLLPGAVLEPARRTAAITYEAI